MPTITNTRSPKPGVYPFWFWNGVQEESRIAEQLEAMKAGGCRGVVLHSREGNRIPYLSERWFELVLHSCDCAKRLGLTIWLYDEDGYPSGNAGMQVQKLRPDLRQKQMLFAYAGTDPDTPAYAAYDAMSAAEFLAGVFELAQCFPSPGEVPGQEECDEQANRIDRLHAEEVHAGVATGWPAADRDEQQRQDERQRETNRPSSNAHNLKAPCSRMYSWRRRM